MLRHCWHTSSILCNPRTLRQVTQISSANIKCFNTEPSTESRQYGGFTLAGGDYFRAGAACHKIKDHCPLLSKCLVAWSDISMPFIKYSKNTHEPMISRNVIVFIWACFQRTGLVVRLIKHAPPMLVNPGLFSVGSCRRLEIPHKRPLQPPTRRWCVDERVHAWCCHWLPTRASAFTVDATAWHTVPTDAAEHS